MDTSKKTLIGATGAAVAIGGVVVGLILSKMLEKADLFVIHTGVTMEAPKETLPATTQAQETEEAAEFQESATFSVSVFIETYTSGKISIQYPAVDQLDNASKKDKTNELSKTNALSVIKANDIDEANGTLDIKCRVTSVDRKRLTAIYTGTLSAKGAVHPVNLFYPNIVNLLQAQNLGLDDFIDAHTIAGYVLSDDVKSSGISSDVEAQVLSYHSSMDLDFLIVVLNSMDFSLSSETQWPEFFSYESQGTIYFSLLVPHTLGDYVLVALNPTTKQSFYQDLSCADFKTRSGINIIRYLAYNYH